MVGSGGFTETEARLSTSLSDIWMVSCEAGKVSLLVGGVSWVFDVVFQALKKVGRVVWTAFFFFIWNSFS